MTMRSDLKAQIEAATTGVHVYDHLADVVAFPAAVIHRTRTYPKTTGGPNNLEHEVDVHLVVHRAVPDTAESQLEDLFMDIATGLSSPFRWDEFSGAEPMQYNQIDVASGTLRITAKE